MLYFYELKDGKKKMRVVESDDDIIELLNYQNYLKNAFKKNGIVVAGAIMSVVK